jgi:RNA polymerase sigma factor (sigma-70 family)
VTTNEHITQLYKTEYRKIISVLCKLFGLVHLEIAEDIAADTFVAATEQWGLQGIPQNPPAWLYQVAKNKTRDYLKRHQFFSKKLKVKFQEEPVVEEVELDLSPQNISDSQLQMIFTICNPTLPAESQIALALRILCGLGIEEIAAAFLTNKETINKRLFRAKEKLRKEVIHLHPLPEIEMPQRLDAVLATLYLLFNGGYHTSSEAKTLRKEWCLEAMRLNYFLVENELTNLPKVNALLALMCFHASRFEARSDTNGDPVLYDDQNIDLWDEDLIQKGYYYLIQSAKGNEISKYHLEASIAYWHSSKIHANTKWERILDLYNQLLQIEYSPMAALNRTYAVSQVYGKEKALKEAQKLDLDKNHFYQTLLGKLYTDLDTAKARFHFEQALQLAPSGQGKVILNRYLQALV